MKRKEWLANFEAGIPEGYPNLTCGWPDAEHGIVWDAYKEYCEACVEGMVEGADAPSLPIFDDWKLDEREKLDENLGFSHRPCDICGALPGDRHPVTASAQPGGDYIALQVCGDCLQYIANAEVPDWLENR